MIHDGVQHPTKELKPIAVSEYEGRKKKSSNNW